MMNQTFLTRNKGEADESDCNALLTLIARGRNSEVGLLSTDSPITIREQSGERVYLTAAKKVRVDLLPPI